VAFLLPTRGTSARHPKKSRPGNRHGAAVTTPEKRLAHRRLPHVGHRLNRLRPFKTGR
jgi:hypothetical protein